MKKRYLSILLVLALCLGLTIAALASEDTGEEVVDEPSYTEEIIEEAEPAHDGATIIDSGTCGDGLTWELDDEGTLTISGIGILKPTLSAPWTIYLETIASVVIEPGVTVIASHAFFNSKSLKSVTIPDSVVVIGREAFANCTGLTSITIPDGVTEIGIGAFCGCTSLTEVHIGSGVIRIGEETDYDYSHSNILGESIFAGCVALINLTVSDDNPVYHSSGNCIIETASKTLVNGCAGSEIPNDGSVTSIKEYAFFGTGLSAITIPAGVETIETRAFYNCASLTTVVLSDGLTSIGDSVFYGCTDLTSVVLPDGLVSIGASAFSGCWLGSLTVPVSLTSIGKNAFNNCTGLADVYYAGTEADWAGIDIESGNMPLTKANIHYNAQSPTEPGPTIPPSAVQGDMDGDGILTPNDAVIILQICTGG